MLSCHLLSPLRVVLHFSVFLGVLQDRSHHLGLLIDGRTLVLLEMLIDGRTTVLLELLIAGVTTVLIDLLIALSL